MSYLINLAVAGRVAVVVGGGEVAVRKARELIEANAAVTVVASEPCAAMRVLAESGAVAGAWREYRSTDLDGAFLAIAATNDAAVNARVSRDAQSLGVLVNVVDDPPLCSFTAPATLRRGRLTVAVSTDGGCPAFAGILREELEAEYGPEYAEVVDLMSRLRRRMIDRGWEGRRIREGLGALYRDGIAEMLAGGDRQRVREVILTRLGPEFDV